MDFYFPRETPRLRKSLFRENERGIRGFLYNSTRCLDMIRAHETFHRSCTDTGNGNWWGRYADTRHMYSAMRRGMLRRWGRRGDSALIYSHVLAIVSPGFDCPCCLENYRARWIPSRDICKAEVRVQARASATIQKHCRVVRVAGLCHVWLLSVAKLHMR